MEEDHKAAADILKAALLAAQELQEVLDTANEHIQEGVEEINSDLALQLDKLTRLQSILPAKEIEDAPLAMFSCTSELKFVPWKEASSLQSPAKEHVAIQIPSKQPTSEDLNPSRRGREQMVLSDRRKEAASDPDNMKHSVPESTAEKKRPFRRVGLPRDSQPLEELPDRIRICSQRLSIFLDYNIHDTTFNWSSHRRTPFIIPRPFKFLVEKGDDIRRELAGLEQIRQRLFPGHTEETHDAVWKANPPEDDLPPEVVNPADLEHAQLTALIKDLRCLTTFMDGYITPSLTIGEVDHVYFSDLWFVFPARSLIYMRDKKVPQKIWKVIQRTGGSRDATTEAERTGRPGGDRTQGGLQPFVIDCFHLDYDGTRYVHTYCRVQIDYFEDCQPIASLPVVPIKAAEKAGLIDRESLVARGREFASCTRPRHKQYTGRNQTLRPNGAKLHEKDADVPENAARYAEWIESEVMVDFERALQEMPGWRPGVNELELFKASAARRNYEGIDIDTVWDAKLSEQVVYEEWEKSQRWDKDRTSPSEEEDLLLLPERVFAFVFRTRKWACLKLGRDNDGEEMLKEKACRPEPWNDLQLPDGHKRLVQSLIESHSLKQGPRNLHFDLVRAKGKGVTILLHGVPGVGKTSTAECAAEANNRPLLPITCGDLGATPREVEKKLEEAFQLAQLWNCVLLLDEADIFLAQRNENDIARNAMVSVFLRVLEYYEGVLFLTTNRVGVFDEAFKSRIHLPLYYPSLEWKYTQKIWHTHLKKLEQSKLIEVDVDDILAYAENFFERQSARDSKIGPVWNGRQIRNAFQSVVALAGYKTQSDSEGRRIRIDREHFERVSKVSNEFNHYIWSIKTQTDADKAERHGYRFDRYEADETIHMKAVVHPEAPGQRSGALTFGPKLAGVMQGGGGGGGLPVMNNHFQTGFAPQGFSNHPAMPNNFAQQQGFGQQALGQQGVFSSSQAFQNAQQNGFEQQPGWGQQQQGFGQQQQGFGQQHGGFNAPTMQNVAAGAMQPQARQTSQVGHA